MKKILLLATTFMFCLGNTIGQAKVLTNDPLTGLPLIPATGAKNVDNAPVTMPEGQICNSKMQGDFYSLDFAPNKIKVNDVISWYAAHLPGFKKVQGSESGRSQTAFYNSDRTIVIFVTGNKGAPGENTDAYAVAYERYQPGISEKTIVSLTQRKMVCN